MGNDHAFAWDIWNRQFPLLTPHGERSPELRPELGALPKPPNPSWGTITREPKQRQQVRAGLLTPHGERSRPRCCH